MICIKVPSTRIEIESGKLFKKEVSKIDPDEQFFKYLLNKIFFTNALVFKNNEENFIQITRDHQGDISLQQLEKKYGKEMVVDV